MSLKADVPSTFFFFFFAISLLKKEDLYWYAKDLQEVKLKTKYINRENSSQRGQRRIKKLNRQDKRKTTGTNS